MEVARWVYRRMPCRSALSRTISPHSVSLGWCVLWVLRCGALLRVLSALCVCVKSIQSLHNGRAVLEAAASISAARDRIVVGGRLGGCVGEVGEDVVVCVCVCVTE